MSRVTERCAASQGKAVFISDFSPPRGADLAFVEEAKHLPVDFICVAYSPGRSVRADSAVVAHEIRRRLNRDVIFNLATRDMNKLAAQDHLLGAQLLGLENVVVVGGDPFTEKDLAAVKDVSDFKPTDLIRAIKSMNQGLDYKGLKLRAPTGFCVGATIDLGRGVEREARLARKKVSAGADFFITQPIFDPGKARGFEKAYAGAGQGELATPVFYGLQVLQKDGVIFADVPEAFRRDLDRGRPGTDIAVELLRSFLESGIRMVYLVPPILKGGLRDYAAAHRVLELAGQV